jgi:UDP-N-acetylmuramyl-tripeptide synthetase
VGGVRLGSLLNALAVKDFVGMEDQVITSIHCDSRTVEPGGLFVAIEGLQTDGHHYVEDAIGRGAVAVVRQKDSAVSTGASVITVDNSRLALAALSAAFYGHPSRELYVIGITGTNGKTTTAYLVEAILNAAGCNVGVIGTINYRFGGKHFDNPVTTPESLDLMRILRQMADNGVTHVVLEVSSHALDLDRVAFCEFDIGVFTNLSRDHLDYHGDMDTYWQCKKKLCVDCLGIGSGQMEAAAVVNWDDAKGKELASDVSVRCLRTGLSEECEIRGDVQITIDGSSGTVEIPEGRFDYSTPLIGRHNVYNVLAAAGVATAMGLSLSTIKEGIETLRGVPGRLEPVANDADFSVFVDYAHTPDALENVLNTLKDLTAGRLITVFGCGGDRDRDKRPMMGKASGRFSDLSILTSDNPRTEEPEAILEEIEKGVREVQDTKLEPAILNKAFEGPGYTVEPDRRRAISLGINVAKPGDTVLIAGKGHETYQLIGGETLTFDDCIEAKKALDRALARGEEKK